MTEESPTHPQPPAVPAGGKNIQVGNIGAGARVAIGENISWIEGLARRPGGDELTRQLVALLEQIRGAEDLPEADRSLAHVKTRAVADALPAAQSDPQRFHTALLDAQVFLQARAAWVWERLRSALTSEAAGTIVSGIAEGTVKGAIKGLLGP
jgi:hypothetical protein